MKVPTIPSISSWSSASDGQALGEVVRTQPVARVEIFWKSHILFTTQHFPTPCTSGARSLRASLAIYHLVVFSSSPLLHWRWGMPGTLCQGLRSTWRKKWGAISFSQVGRMSPVPGSLRLKVKHPLITAARAGSWDDAGHRRETFGLSSELLWPHAAFLCLPSACSGNSANQNSLLTVWVGFKHLSLI